MKYSIVTLLLCLQFFGACSKDKNSLIKTRVSEKGILLRIKVTAGEHFIQPFKFGIFKGEATPQLAVWAEDLAGMYRETLFVTRKFATQEWRAASGQDPDATFRVMSLPYWMHKYMSKGFASPTKNNPLPDTITGASPTVSFNLISKVAESKEQVYILMEVNNSFDKNETYTTIAGQPALVYRAKVNLTQAGRYPMYLAGVADAKGENGSLKKDFSPITTARSIIKKAVVIVQ
jgi:hypothetical protein